MKTIPKALAAEIKSKIKKLLAVDAVEKNGLSGSVLSITTVIERPISDLEIEKIKKIHPIVSIKRGDKKTRITFTQEQN